MDPPTRSSKRKEPPESGNEGGAKRKKPTCKVGGCPNQVQSEGLCRRHGAKTPRAKKKKYVRPTCSIDGCDSYAQRGGRCESHGAKRPERKKCSVGGCDNQAVKGGVCVRHGAKKKQCSAKGCDNNALKEGVCITHGAKRKQCSAEGCGNQAVKEGVCISHGAEVPKCSVEGCTKYARSGRDGLCKRHYNARQQQTVSEDSDDGQDRRAAKRSWRSTETEMASVEGAQQGVLGHQAGQENPRQQVEQVGHQHGASHLEIHEQPAHADFNEMPVAHGPNGDVNSEETIEFGGNNEAPLPPPIIEDAGAMHHQSARIFDKYDGDKVDMTQDDGNEDCSEQAPSQKGVEYVLKVAEKEVKVKKERIEVAETRAAVAEQKLAAVEKEKEKAGLAAKVANKKAVAAKRKAAAAVQDKETAVLEKESALEHVACRICEVVKDEKYVMITCGHVICFECFYKGEEVQNRDDPNKCPFCRRVLRKESKKLKRVYL